MELNTFIDALYMKTYIIPNTNIDDNRITPVIMNAQRQYIRNLLGKTLYNRIGNLIINQDTTPLTAEIQVLLNEYIAPCLGTYVKMKLRPELTHQLTNKGSQEKNGEFSQASSDDAIKWLMDTDLADANAFANDLIIFLSENNSLYPDFIPSKPVRGGLYTGPAVNYDGGYVNGRRTGYNNLGRIYGTGNI